MGNNNYDELKRMYARVWRTWDNASVLSYVFLPNGTVIRIGFKDYQMPILVNHTIYNPQRDVPITTVSRIWNQT